MGAVMRSIDWSQTPIGPVASWSPSLRMMVSLLLTNRFPLLLWWGPHFCQLYNDPYRPVLGTKHPTSMGQPASACWSEIWHIIGPLIKTPYYGGPATWMEDLGLEINRHGFVEETHFTVAYSPVPDGTVPGGIGGVLATVHEISDKVVGERRVEVLRDLGARSSEAKTADDACAIAAETLAQHPKDLPFALLYLLDIDGKRVRLAGASGVHTGASASPLVIDLSGDTSQEGVWPVAEAVRTETIQLVDDLAARFDPVPPGPWLDPPRAAAVVPIRSHIAHQLAGVLVAGLSSRLRFDGLYHSFLELVTTQVATAIANARAYEEERQRAEALAEIDRAKTAFFSNVSHEFRTPLTLMLGPLEQTLAGGNGALTPPQREELDVVHRNGLRLLKLVNTLLDFSRIEAGRVQASYEPTDLAAVTADLASVFRSAIERAGLRLLVDCPPLPDAVYIDRDMWEKIVLNLLSNAFKFTFEGEVAVSLRWCGEHVELTVRDTGSGIPPHELPHIFERFHRIHNARARTHEGTGIGLALVQELVRLHGGQVAVTSTVEAGTTFTVSLPTGTAHLPADRVGTARGLASTALGVEAFVEEAWRWLPDEPAGGTVSVSAGTLAPPGSRAPAPACILLVDDNADMRDYVRRLLSQRWEVVAVADGLQALAVAGERLPDLVLADVMMPGLDGLALLHALRADPRTRAIPVILLSARAGEESRVEGLEAGADDYLIKPFSARELLVRVEAHLTLKRLREETQATVSESEQQYRQLLHALPAAIYTCDTQGRIMLYNQAAVALWGQEPEVGKDLWCGSWRMYEPDGRPMPLDQCPMAVAIREGRPIRGQEMVIERPNGTRCHVLPYPEPIRNVAGEVVGAINMLMDLTDRKQAEAVHERLAAIVDSSDDAIIGHTLDGVITSWNRSAERLYGYTAAEVIGQPVAFLAPPDLPDEVPQILERLKRGERVDHYETQRQRKDGTRLNVSLTISPIRVSTGRIIGASKIARDVTERKQAEAALQQVHAELERRVEERTALLALIQDITRIANEAVSSAAALQMAVDRICAYTGWPVGHAYLAVAPGTDRWAPTSIWHLDAPERFTSFQQATQTVEVAAGEGLTGRVGALGKPEWRSEVATDPTFHRQRAALEVGLQGGFALPILVGHEVAGVLEFYTTEMLAPHWTLLDAMTQIGTQLGRIVERERAAEQLQHQQAVLFQREKLASMGSLLASVAHELNNPLAIVLMQADLLREDAGNGPLAEAAEEISQAATRCERLVRQFLTLARQHAPERTAVDLNALITDTIEILAQPLQLDNIVVKLRLARNLPRLWADPHQLQQVLVNLLTNAHQALRDVAPPRHVTLTTRCNLAHMQATLEVADTGPGIPPATRARIFEPFFTTKPAGVGTGLGLSLCQGIIEGHGGTLSVTSPPGQGATFRITLPVDVVPETPSTIPDGEGTQPTVPSTTILVVDDEPGITKALTRLLCRDGHTVDTATNGRLALAKLQERPYDLILSDLRMPELDGPGLYRALAEHTPQLCRRFIFLTGDTLSPETMTFFAQSGVFRLTKPFTAAAVRRAIQQVLQAE